MRITKAMLEDKVILLNREVNFLQTRLEHKLEIIKIYESHSRLPISAITIALEGITAATAHVLGDLREIGRRRQ